VKASRQSVSDAALFGAAAVGGRNCRRKEGEIRVGHQKVRLKSVNN